MEMPILVLFNALRFFVLKIDSVMLNIMQAWKRSQSPTMQSEILMHT